MFDVDVPVGNGSGKDGFDVGNGSFVPGMGKLTAYLRCQCRQVR